MPIVLTSSVASKFFPNTVFDKQSFTNIHIMYCIYSYIFSLLNFERKNSRQMSPPHHNFFLSLTLLLILLLWTGSCMVNSAFSSRMSFIRVRTDQVLRKGAGAWLPLVEDGRRESYSGLLTPGLLSLLSHACLSPMHSQATGAGCCLPRER